MSSIILELFLGNLSDEQNLTDKKFREKELREEKRDKAHDAFWDSLSEEQRALFDKWDTEDKESWCDLVEAAYIRGFKIGARFALEICDLDLNE